MANNFLEIFLEDRICRFLSENFMDCETTKKPPKEDFEGHI